MYVGLAISSAHFNRPIKKISAFTLLELVTVIAIVSIIIALVLPSLASARIRGKQAGCLANLRSLGQGQMMYSSDNNGLLPNLNPAGMVGNQLAATQALLGLDEKYLKSPAVFHCPLDRDPIPSQLTTADYDMQNSARISYDFYSIWWLPQYGPPLDRVAQAPLTWDLKGGRKTENRQQNHGTRGGDVVFGDGHAEWQAREDWDRENWPRPADVFYRPK